MPAPDSYITISRPGRADLKVKGSRFLGFANKVGNEEQAEKQRVELKRKYHDARHIPFAYRLADGSERSSDDGEPHGTSGPAILSEIQSAGLFDVQLVVVRYFGGTKLGKGGLARAFSDCARLTLEEAGKKTVLNTGCLSLVLPPEKVNLAKAIASKFGAEVMSLTYDMKARLNLAVPSSQVDSCRETLESRFGAEIFYNRD
jgi:putative IMPACT (imprinted ancient) family translation regulator